MDNLKTFGAPRKKVIAGSLTALILVSLVVTAFRLPLVQAETSGPSLQWSDDLGTEALGFAIGDTDNDGATNELVVMTSGSVYVLKWNVSSSVYDVEWSTPISAQSSPVWKRVIVADTDNDGLNEIAISAYGSSPALTIGGQSRCAFIYEWDGVTYVLHSTTPLAGRSTDSIAVGDVDGDGKNEVVVGTTDGYYYGHVRVLEWNDATSTYVEEWSYGDPVASGYGSEFDPPYSYNKIYANLVTVGDVDNDGSSEIIAGDHFGHFFVFKWDGSTYQSWVYRELGYGWNAFGIAINDADNDNDNEIIVGTAARIGSLQWDDFFEAYEEYDQINLGSNLWWYGLAVGEVDYDGDNELIAGNTNGEVYVFEWNGSSYVEEWSTDIGDRAWGAAIGDADNDGLNEFVTGNYGGEVFVYKFQVKPTKDVLIINDPQKLAYFGWYRASQMSPTGFELLNRTVMWASSFMMPNETRIDLFRESGDTDANELYNWLLSGGYPAENIILHPTRDAELLSSSYYDDSDLVIYWNTHGYDSSNIVNSAVPFITVSAMQTDEMRIGTGITTMHALNDTFHIVNNNYYPTDIYSLGPLVFNESYPFEATTALPQGRVLITAEVESIHPQVEMSVTQDVAVLSSGDANISFNITIPESPLADILRETFFTDATSLDPDVEYDVPDNKTVEDEAAVEEAIKDMSLQGDVSDGDGQVEQEDLEFIARIFGYLLGDEEWDAELDVNWDGKVDMRDIAAAAHNYGKTTKNTGGLYVAGYYNGTAVNCTDLYYRGPEGSSKINMSESGHIWYNLHPGNYTVYGTYETVETSTNVTVTSGNVTYAQLDFGGAPPPTPQTRYEPVKDVFYQGIVMEQLLLLGFDINVTEAKIVPYSTANKTIVTLTAHAPHLASLTQYPNWTISVGPWDENSTTAASEFVFTKIQYMTQMLQSFPGDQLYIYNWQMGIDLPLGADLLNGAELSGLNWTIDFGGGTFMQANVTMDLGTIVVTEMMVVTERSITASEEYLGTAFGQYKIFSINYSYPDGPLTQITEGTNKPEGDWSKTWSKTITPGSYVKTWTYGYLKTTLKITPTLTAQWYVGWEKKWSWGGLKLKWFKTWIKVTPSIKVEASVSASASYSKSWSYSFWTWSSRFYFWVGAVPVWANLKLKVTGAITVTTHGKISLSTWATVSAWYKGGVKYENGWSTIWEHGSGGSRGGPTISGTASLSVTPKATCRVLFLFYDVSGPYVDAIPYAPITIYYYTYTTSDRWYIYLKFKIKAGVTMSGWLKSTVGVGSYSKQLADWTLKSWSGYW